MTLSLKIKQVFAAFCISLFTLPALADIALLDGHVRAMPPSVPNTAAYFRLANQGDKPVRLINVTSTAAKDTQIHTIIEQDGLVKMKRISGLDLMPSETLVLNAGGDHIMLLGLTEPLVIGQQVPLQLQFDDGQQLDILLPVTAIAVDDGHQHHH
ncbi:copper chaperone PCu(A)C [Shewanella sp. NIFS-20-20]|uniref:copper chaperone PCu(A)C n=1 Tax=Shewanella sp. NIFS-20-20 TaxID=2853806 RepID=UPI00210E5EC4|nr:copper chaperone PCu(A)C [Shewanella sp. NIFS-20-20]